MSDGVVPVAVEVVTDERHRLQLSLGHLGAGLVVVEVLFRPDGIDSGQ